MAAKVHLGALLTLTAQGAGTLTSPDQSGRQHDGLELVVNISAQTGTPNTTITIEGKDEVSGNYYTVLASAALAAVATTVLRVFPDSAVTANLAANAALPKVWRVKAVVAGTSPVVTATIGATVF
jgi:hypothetical protein